MKKHNPETNPLTSNQFYDLISLSVTIMEIMTKNKPLRFNLTIMNENDKKIIAEFKSICKKNRKRYSRIILELMKEHNETYHATR